MRPGYICHLTYVALQIIICPYLYFLWLILFHIIFSTFMNPMWTLYIFHNCVKVTLTCCLGISLTVYTQEHWQNRTTCTYQFGQWRQGNHSRPFCAFSWSVAWCRLQQATTATTSQHDGTTTTGVIHYLHYCSGISYNPPNKTH